MSVEEIVARHGGMVFGVCRRALGNHQEAEDAAQTVFLIFLEKVPSLSRGTDLAPWLYRTAVFVCSNRIRSRIRRDLRPPAPPAPEAATERAWEEAKPHLDEALARLPGPQQEAIVVHYLQGLTLGQTAETLGCTVKALEKRVGRGLEKLRQLLLRAGVAIAPAALVALLQSEAGAAAPLSLQEALRGRSLPPPRSPFLLRKLLLPASAAMVVVAFITGALRSVREERRGGAEAPAVRSTDSPERVAAAASPVEGAAAGPGASAILSFPATFDEFADRFKKLRALPESLELWRGIGIDLELGELREIYHRDEFSEDDRFVARGETGHLLTQGFELWARRNPRAAADWIRSAFALLPADQGWRPELPFDAEEPTFLGTVLSAWLRQDPDAAHAWVVSVPSGPVATWIAIDYGIQACRQAARPFNEIGGLLQRLPYSWERCAAIATVAEEWARRDPQAAAAWMERLPRMPGPVSVEGDEEQSLKPFADRPKPEGHAGELLDHARYYAASNVARSWAKIDPLAAIRWGSGLADAEEQSYAMDAIGEVWTAADPAAALHFASAHPDASWRRLWIRMAAGKLAEADPQAAREAVRLLPPEFQAGALSLVISRGGDRRPRETANEILRAIVAFGPQQALAFDGVLSNLAYAWVREEPVAAAAWASTIVDPKLRDMACSKIGVAWTHSDPIAAVEWVRRLPPGEAQVCTVGVAVCALAPRNLETARRLLAEIPPGDLRLGAISNVAHAWAEAAPEAALLWARALPNAEDRAQGICSILSTWGFNDADAANAAAERLEGEVREEALRMVEAGRLRARRETLRKELLRDKRK